MLCKGDSLIYSFGQMLSTRDQDNDGASYSCAVLWHGAWWYKNCAWSNLNGLYLRGSGPDRVTWLDWKNSWYSMRFSEMNHFILLTSSHPSLSLCPYYWFARVGFQCDNMQTCD